LIVKQFSSPQRHHLYIRLTPLLASKLNLCQNIGQCTDTPFIGRPFANLPETISQEIFLMLTSFRKSCLCWCWFLLAFSVLCD